MHLFTPYLLWSLTTHVWFDIILSGLRFPQQTSISR
jgi:hypothetical protein